MSELINIQLGYRNSAWFTTNASFILLEGQIVYLDDQSGKYKLGDGTTTLAALNFLGGGSGVQSVTGPQVDDTDPLNPVVNLQTALTSPDGFTSVEVINGLAVMSGSDGTNACAIQVRPTYIELIEPNITVNTPLMANSNKSIKSLTDAVWGSFIAGLNSKTTPVNADSIEISDSAVSGTAKKVSLTNFKAFLKTYFDTIYTTTSAVATQITTALSGYVTETGTQTLTNKVYVPIRESMIDANKTFSSGKTEVYLSVALTAVRTLTLPLASAFPAGTQLIFLDEIGGLTSTNYVIITRAGSDTINGGISINLRATNGKAIITTNGVDKWTASVDVNYSEGTWTPTITGFSSNPTGTYEYTLNGDICTDIIAQTVDGTSNATTFTITLSHVAKSRVYAYGEAVDNNVALTNYTVGFVNTGSNVLTLFKNTQNGAWTASNGKRVFIVVTYKIA